MKYKQCVLINGTLNTVSWIPEKFAKKGHMIKLKNGEQWVNGWIVESVGSESIDEKHLPDSHAAVKSHRKSTGDSMPKKG